MKVYLISCGQYHKIGITNDLTKRIQQLQTGAAERILYVDSFESNQAVKDEQRIHQELYQYRVRGEWFDIPTSLLICRSSWFKSYPPVYPLPDLDEHPFMDPFSLALAELPW